MWKAILVLFMTSNTQPVALMVGQFPELFMSKTECQSFVAKARPDINGQLAAFTGVADIKLKVLHHEMSCIENTDGQPV